MSLVPSRLVAVLAAALVASTPALAQLHGRVEQHSFVGPVLGNTVLFNIYLPQEYGTSTARYPVIYYLHGLDGSQGGPSNTVVPRSFEDALAAGIIGPVIIVFANGYLDSLWADSIDGAKPAETDVVYQLIPHVDANFRTLACPSYRVMTGFSMGGFGAPKFYAKFPHLFTACIAYDGSLADWDTLLRVRPDWAASLFGNSEAYFDQYSPWYWGATNASVLAPRNDLRLVVGADLPSNRRYRDFLAALGISTDYVETGCPHDMNCLLAAQGMNSAAFIAARLGSPTLTDPPSVSRHPAPALACPSGSAALSVIATGAGTLAYQWLWLPDAPGPWVNVVDGPNTDPGSGLVRFAAAGSGAATITVSGFNDPDPTNKNVTLSVRVTNACGSVTSDPATLTICHADYNCDGFMDGLDSDLFNNDFENPDPDQQIHADYNGDLFVDGIDYDLFMNDFEAGCG